MGEVGSYSETLGTIVSIIAEALAIDPTNIKPQTRLFGDLEAESIDIVDVRFRMEQAFGFKINQNDLMAQIGVGLSNEEIVERFNVDYLVRYIMEKKK